MLFKTKTESEKKISQCDTRALILKCAATEFLKNGWEKSNIRKIAKEAGVTTGSLYFHFKSKADIFEELVKDTYEELLRMQKKMYEDHFAIPIKEAEKRKAFRLQGRRSIVEYSYKHSQAVKLLLCASEGTEYSDLFDKMMEITRNADICAFNECKKWGILEDIIDTDLIIAIDKTSWRCLFEPVCRDIPYEKAVKYADLISDFYEAGWCKIFSGIAENR